MGKTWFNRFETLTHSQREEEIEKGCEEEREGYPVPIFPPLSFGIVRLLTGWMSFCSEVLGMWEEHGWSLLNLIGAFVLNLGCSKWLFLVNRRGFEPQGINQRSYGQIWFNWVRRMPCFLHNLGKKVAQIHGLMFPRHGKSSEIAFGCCSRQGQPLRVSFVF